jgi:hypothetical protein
MELFLQEDKKIAATATAATRPSEADIRAAALNAITSSSVQHTLDKAAKDRLLEDIITVYGRNTTANGEALYYLVLGGLQHNWEQKVGDDTLQKLVKLFVGNIPKSTTPAVTLTTNKGRIASLDFQIASSELSHHFDVDAFIEQVQDIQVTWDSYRNEEEDDETKGPAPKSERYDAPYFCFIQSSGMGKTKIMYEAVCQLNKECSWACALVIPATISDVVTVMDADRVFQHRLSFALPAFEVRNTYFREATQKGFDKTR